MEQDLTLFGEVNFRERRSRFGIKIDDRRRHIYIIGKTGMGKSELLKTLAIQDIQNGQGLAFVDPHGDPVEDLLDHIPQERVKDVIYVNPADLTHPVAFNVMEQVDPDKRHLVADGVMNVFKKIWTDVWSSRMEYILNNTILALLEIPNATLLGINRMLSDKDYRKHIVNQLKDPLVKTFWTQEFARYTERFAAEATPAIQNKVGQFISSALIRNIIGQPHSSFDMRKIMDEKKILLVNISKGRIGEDASRLLGALIITKLQLAAMSRVDIPEAKREDFTLIVDEFQNFATSSFTNILSEARKYHLSLIIAHQYVAQMEETVRDAVFGNVGTIVTFRVGAEDAELLEKELTPEFSAQDIINLGKRQIYLKLMIDGVASRAFSARTMDTPPPLPQSFHEEIVNHSRRQYATPVEKIEEAISQWLEATFQNEAGPGKKILTEMDRQPSAAGPSFAPARPASGYWGPEVTLPARRERSSSPARPFTRPPAAPTGTPLRRMLERGAVDFRGRRIEPPSSQPEEIREEKTRPAVDTNQLREILEKALKPKTAGEAKQPSDSHETGPTDNSS